MFRFTSIATTFLLLSSVPAVSGTLPAHDVTADGTWDCKDKNGETFGT